MRRALTIIAIVIVLAGTGTAAYFYFFVNTASVVVAPAGSVDLPIAGQGASSPVEEFGTTTVTTNTSPTPPPRLVKISAGPVVPGEMVVNSDGESSASPSTSLGTGETIVSYIERQSGNVYSYSVRTGTLTRISNRTIPGIQSAVWLPDASGVFVRYLSGADFSTTNTYALRTDGSDGFFLPQNLSDIAVSSTGVLTLSSGVNGSGASLARTDGTHASQIFSTPLSSLRVAFAGKNQYLAYTKPSATLPGAAFLVDGAGYFSRVAGPRNGLVAKASHSGKWLLVSYADAGGAMQMELANVATGEKIPLPIASIADKCVWTADDSTIYCGVPMNPPQGSRYPDDWYRGTVSFTDRIWKIQVTGRYAQFILDFSKETKESLDVEAPAVDSLDTVLVFTNKNDGSLWGYSL